MFPQYFNKDKHIGGKISWPKLLPRYGSVSKKETLLISVKIKHQTRNISPHNSKLKATVTLRLSG